ncbi:hypothetical protein KKF84_20005 [Myxococcota bacterium]|nr:hypothetical protein [Myxococcota bacterium]
MHHCFWIRQEHYAPIIDQLHLDIAPGERVRLLEILTLYNRINALSTIHNSGRGWLGASFSVAEILTALYFDGTFKGPEDPHRDYILLSKGHAAVMQYAAMVGRGLLAPEDLAQYNRENGPQAHSDRVTHGIETNTGSLGQTLSKAAGLALGGARRVFVILGDGELQEGQNYEALMTLHQRQLGQVIPIIDRNGIQTDSETREIKEIPDLGAVLGGFGMGVITINGNHMEQVLPALREARNSARPMVIIADTQKAAGISFMEASSTLRRAFQRHGSTLTRAEYLRALTQWNASPSAQHIGEELTRFIEQAQPRENPPAAAPGPSMGDGFGQHLTQLVKQDPRVVVLSADLEKSCKITPIALSSPERFLEMGIAEQDMVSCAGGLALRGKIPVVNTYAAFFRRAFEQIYVNATEKTQIVYAGHYAGLSYNTDGKTHQATGDAAMMRSIPGMHVLFPAFLEEIPQMLSWYLAEPREAPLYLRLSAKPCPLNTILVPLPFEYGRGAFYRDTGAKICVLTSGPHMIQYCDAAIDTLQKQGINLDLCLVSTLRHLDQSWCARLASTYDHLVIVEELFEAGGLHDELCHALAVASDQGLSSGHPRISHRAVGGLPFSTLDPAGLYKHFQLTPDHLAQWFLSLMDSPVPRQ